MILANFLENTKSEVGYVYNMSVEYNENFQNQGLID